MGNPRLKVLTDPATKECSLLIINEGNSTVYAECNYHLSESDGCVIDSLSYTPPIPASYFFTGNEVGANYFARVANILKNCPDFSDSIPGASAIKRALWGKYRKGHDSVALVFLRLIMANMEHPIYLHDLTGVSDFQFIINAIVGDDNRIIGGRDWLKPVKMDILTYDPFHSETHIQTTLHIGSKWNAYICQGPELAGETVKALNSHGYENINLHPLTPETVFGTGDIVMTSVII